MAESTKAIGSTRGQGPAIRLGAVGRAWAARILAGGRVYHFLVALQRLQAAAGMVPVLVVDASLSFALWLLGAAQLVSDRHPFDDRRHGPGTGGPGGPGGGPGGGGPGGAPPGFHNPDTLTYGLLGLCALSLVPRRRHPLLSLGAVTGFGAAYLARGEPSFTVQLMLLLAVYTAVADTDLSRVAALAVGVASALVLAGAVVAGGTPRTSAAWAMDAAWFIAAMFIGDSVRSRRAYASELERTREEEARRRVADERLEIARELHDVVGHNIALINVQAGAGAHALYGQPEQAKDTFENIRAASHQTLQELRSIVGVLREGGETQPLAPAAGLDALDQLVAATRAAGQDVEIAVEGPKRSLPGIVDLSAYRILQEALTNTVRHAPHARVRVRIEYGNDEVALDIQNERGSERSTVEPGGGHGLEGMRERVAAIGGRFRAAPEPDGGFHVRAVLPLGGTR